MLLSFEAAEKETFVQRVYFLGGLIALMGLQILELPLSLIRCRVV
jgi:hypothetical protein